MPTPRRGFTLVELLVVIGILAVLAAIILPATLGARENGRATACRSNLRQMALALKLYAEDYEGSLPGAWVWDQVLVTSGRISSPLWCPDVRDFRPVPNESPIVGHRLAGYGYNSFLAGLVRPPNAPDDPVSLSQVRYPATTVAFADARVSHVTLSRPDVGEPGLGSEEGALRHRSGANYAFLDGHVKWHRPEEVGGTNNAWPQDGTRPSFRPW